MNLVLNLLSTSKVLISPGNLCYTLVILRRTFREFREISYYKINLERSKTLQVFQTDSHNRCFLLAAHIDQHLCLCSETLWGKSHLTFKYMLLIMSGTETAGVGLL